MLNIKWAHIALMVLLVVAMILALQGCAAETSREVSAATQPVADNSMFVEVECTSIWTVVYHKETLVMYAISKGNYNRGTFTVLVDADGKPLIYND